MTHHFLQPAVAIAPVVPHCKVLVDRLRAGSMVEVRAARQLQLGKELWQGVELFEGVNQHRLIPSGQELPIDAQAFFLVVHWPFSRDRARSAVAGCRAGAIRAGARALPALAPAGSCCCASWMREPHGRVAGFSSCTTSVCIRLTCRQRLAHFSGKCKAP